jgi:large subunit GTPase 1
MVCDGILPIDQLKDYTEPIYLICTRIPKKVLELTYGISLGKEKVITVEKLLSTFAISKGLMAQKNVPNYSYSSKIILKDYMNGKKHN